MRRTWSAVVALGAMTHLVLSTSAHADTTIAQATEAPAPIPAPAPVPAQAPPMQPAPPPPQWQPAPAPAQWQAAPPAPPSGPRVMLRIDRPTARLQQRTMLGWSNICIPPCGAFVDPAGLYRVGGGGATVSEPFSLPRSSGDVYVDGHVGAKASRLVGLGFIIVGALTGVVGGLALINPPRSSTDPGDRDDGTRNRTTGYVTVGIAAGLEIIGIALFAMSHTSLQVR